MIILLFALLVIRNSTANGSVCKNNPNKKIQSETVYNIENCTNTEIDLGNETARASLISVKAAYNQIFTISDDTFKSAKQLTYIDLRENKIGQISVGAFEDQDKLQFLILKLNNLTRIEVGTFNSLVELENLWLQNNQLTLLEKGLFDQNSKLVNLFLNENKIIAIESTVFVKLNAIKSLTLYGNLCINQNFQSNTLFQNFVCYNNYQSFKQQLDQIGECRTEKENLEAEKLNITKKLSDSSDAERNLSAKLHCWESKKRSNSISAEATDISSNFLIIAGIIGLDFILFLISILQICQLFKENKFLKAKLDKLCADNIYERVDSLVKSPQSPSTD